MITPDTPMSADELQAFVEECRKEFWGNSSNLRNMVPELRTGIREALIKQGRGRIDAGMAAYRITRKIVTAARLQEDSARSVLDAWNTFNEQVTGKPRPGTGRTFKL